LTSSTRTVGPAGVTARTSGTASEVPHCAQNFAFGLFSLPQFGQGGMAIVLL
jgi:hypothetical protein